MHDSFGKSWCLYKFFSRKEIKNTNTMDSQVGEEDIAARLDEGNEENPESCSVTPISHQEVIAYVEDVITSIIKSDPLLQYLPSGVTLEELNSMLALEHGRAMTVVVHRADNEKYSVVVEQKATVMDLKKAIQRHVALKLKREGSERTISWRYIWRTYWLTHAGEKLTHNDKLLKEYDIKNNSELTFVKRLKNK